MRRSLRCLAPAALLLASSGAFAHEAGLGTTTIVVGADSTWVFASVDAAPGSAARSAANPREALVTLRMDGEAFEPLKVERSTRELGHIAVRSTYPALPDGELVVAVPATQEAPAGFRCFVDVRAADGTRLASALMTPGGPELRVPLDR